MNNLFKRSVASLALVGAMTGSLFGGNAAYIDIRVNYLSGTGKATLGYESWNSTTKKFKAGAKKDLVELYIRVLDKDGEFADKNNKGKALENMSVTRSGSSITNFGTGDGETQSTGSHVIQRGKIATPDNNSKAIADKNAARYTIDYSMQNLKSLIDTLHIKAGNLEKNTNINLVASDAKGLIVRATKKGKTSATGGVLNAFFTNIDVEGDNNLSAHSNSVSQITAGEKVPLKIYASTASSNYANGRFTSSDDSLNGKTIVVFAVGDYDFNDSMAKTTTYLSQTELIMNNGVASGEMVINYGLPDKNTSGSTGPSNNTFSSSFIGGLGVAFIAYVKDDSTISNNGVIALSEGVLRTDKTNFVIEGNNADTDVLKVKSGSIVGFKAGDLTKLNKAPSMASNYFSDRSNVFIANSRGLKNAEIDDSREIVNIVAVDKLGNPGTIGTFIKTTSSNVAKNPTKFKIGTETINSEINKSNVSFSIDTGDINISNADTNMTTNSVTGITTADLNITDGLNKSATRINVEAYYTADAFDGMPPAILTVTILDVMGETPKDIKGDLRSSMNLDITNTDGKLKTEHTSETDFSDTKLYISVLSVEDEEADVNITLSLKVLNSDGETDKNFELNSTFGVNTVNTNTGYTVSISGNSTTATERIISINGGTTGTGTITFNNTSISTYVVGSKTVVTLKGSGNADTNRSHRKYVDASVKTTISSKGAEDFVDSITEKGIPGQVVIDFDFSGDFITQNVGNTRAKIIFGDENGSKDANDSLKVGLVGKPFSSASTINGSANTATINALIPPSGRLSVVLYGAKRASTDVNKPETSLHSLYNISSITVNELKVLATSRDGNDLTKAIEVDFNTEKNITMAASTNKTASKVKIVSLGTANSGEGDANDKPTTLPQGLIGADDYGTSPIKTKSTVKVLTNTYYTLFSNKTDLIVQDVYGNAVDMESFLLGDNYKLTTSDAECSIVKMNDGSNSEPATIFFKDCAAGKEVVVTVTTKGSLEENKAFNTITFTNIMASSENTKFVVSLNVGSETYNVANNDVVIKIVGDGNTKVEKANIVVTSEDKDAQITLRPVLLLSGSEFTSLVSNGKLTEDIDANGNYYVIRSDKKGKVTVKVDATIPKAQAKSKKDTPITGSVSFNVTLVDLVVPTATVKATANGITATITDLSLDETATTVEVYQDGTKFKSLTGSAGVYTAKVPQGLYSVIVHAVDVGGNTLDKSYPILVGKAGATSATLETTLINTGSYDIAGTFSSYDFADKDAAFDWVYTDNEGVSYQLLGNAPTAKQPFGWKETDVKTTSKDWYMIKLTGDDEGPFGWVLINKSTNAAFKLQGAKADHTFEFSGALYLKAAVDGSSVKFTKK